MPKGIDPRREPVIKNVISALKEADESAEKKRKHSHNLTYAEFIELQAEHVFMTLQRRGLLCAQAP